MVAFYLNALAGLRLGLRARALRALFALGVLLIGAAFLSGAFSLRQPVVVALDVGLSGLRLLGVLLVLFWVQEAFVKDLERRTITLALSYPSPRSAYVLGRFAGVMLLVFLAVLIWGALLFVMARYSAWGYADSSQPVFGAGYVATLAGICLDLATIGAVVLCLASVSRTPLLPFLAGGAFALAARSFGPVLDYLSLSADADPLMKSHFLPLLDWVRWLLPDLSRLDWRDWVLYGMPPSANEMLGGALIALGYFVLALALAVWVYARREID